MGRVQLAVGQKITKQEFPKPDSFVVEGKPAPEEIETRASNAGVIVTGQSNIRGPATNVRLRSLRSIVNNKHLPKWVQYRISQQPLQKEIDDYIAQAEINGFAIGALVARKWGITNNWEKPQMWGMIVVVREVQHEPQKPYAPFMVKWIMSTEIEPAWAEDLYCMAPAMDDGLIWGIVEAQGFDIALYSANDSDEGSS